MSRFDVYRHKTNQSQLFLDVQADVLCDLKTCVVVPLVPLNNYDYDPTERLRPKLMIEGLEYIMVTTDIGATQRSRLGPKVASVVDDYYPITNALDFLFQGY